MPVSLPGLREVEVLRSSPLSHLGKARGRRAGVGKKSLNPRLRCHPIELVAAVQATRSRCGSKAR